MRIPFISRIIFILLSEWMVVGAHLADYSKSHIFNPHWPPHAKFHCGQTLTFSVLLAALTIYFAVKKSDDLRTSVLFAAIFSSLYYLAQIGAAFYPNTAFCDPEFPIDPAHTLFGIPPQLVVATVSLMLTAQASYLAVSSSKQGDLSD
jgi:hypothetical protein